MQYNDLNDTNQREKIETKNKTKNTTSKNWHKMNEVPTKSKNKKPTNETKTMHSFKLPPDILLSHACIEGFPAIF